jgi:hypothetical protein
MHKTKRPPGEGGRESQCALELKAVQLTSDSSTFSRCPRFARCSAPICPLDPHHLESCHLRGERICFYLTELVKPGVWLRVRGSSQGELLRDVAKTLPGIVSRYGPIRRELRRSAKTGSRWAHRPGEPRKGAAA